MIFIILDAQINNTMNITINTLEDVKQFVHILMEEEQLNFHPDTPFENYICYETRQPTYSEDEAALRNRLLSECFELGNRIGVDTHELICDYGSELLFGRLMPI